MNRFVLVVCILFCFTTTFAQKKVLGMPMSMMKPYDLYGNNFWVKKMINNTSEKSDKYPWFVVSDRDNNAVFKKPSLSSELATRIHIKDFFYIVDEEKGWIKIALAKSINELKPSRLKVIGWVEKEKMLLWRVGLIDNRTKIKKKAILVNRADNIDHVFKRVQEGTDDLVYFYNSPGLNSKIDSSHLFAGKFYFIFKKDADKYLLGEATDLSPFNVEQKLLGWVNKHNIQEWNTRVCIEPNFEERAYQERKHYKEFRFKGFTKLTNLKNYVVGKEIENVAWLKDPVEMDELNLSILDKKRFKADIMRFPVLGKRHYRGVDYFRTGVIREQVFVELGIDSLREIVLGNQELVSKIKLNLFTEVYIPAQVNAAKFPMYSYVILLSEPELLQYQNLISRLVSDAKFGSYSVKRKKLFEMYLALVEQFMGEDYFITRAPEDITKKEFLNLVQGLKKEGVNMGLDMNVRIGEVLDGMEESNEVIDILVERFETISEKLETIIRLNDQYDFCVQLDEFNRFYWLRLDQVF